MADTGLIADRALAYVALLLVAGLPLYLLTAGRGIGLTARVRQVLALLAVVAGAASLWWALASIAAMAAQPIAELDRATIAGVLAATPLGSVLIVRLTALGLLLLALGCRWPLGVAALAGTVALITAAWTGHAGATEGLAGSAHRLVDALHLLAAATWLGALAMLMAGVFGTMRPSDLVRRLAGFASVGTVIVATLLATGVANMLFVAGWPLPLDSGWALLLGIKTALFAAMLGLAGLNRWRLTPALAAGRPGARRRLRRALVAEAMLGLAVVAVVAMLGLLDPAS